MTASSTVKGERSPIRSVLRNKTIVVPPESLLTLPEVIVGSAVLIVAVLSWMALLLFDNHVGTLPAVGATAVGALLVVVVLGRLLARRPAIATDPWTLGVLAVVGGIGAFLFFPGYSYGITDKDPGVYMAIGASMARTHSYSFRDVLGQHVPRIVEQSPGSRFPGIWLLPHTTTVVPQFYHLWPALLAVANDVGGLRAEAQVAPFIGVLAVCAFVLLVRRAVPGRVSLPAAAIGGLLLETNMMEVWQAKYPSTEILAQLLFVTMLLGICISLYTGWAPAAGAAGMLLGIGWLERPDVLLIIGIAAVAGAVLIAIRRFDARARWFTAGLAVVLPHAIWQAYAGARQYTLANAVPRLTTVTAGVAALVVVAIALRAITPVSQAIPRLLGKVRWQFGLGFALCVVVAALMAFGFLRPRLLGDDMSLTGGKLLRTYNEANMRRLSWFLTLGAFPLAGLGLAVVALRRWRAALWVAILPSLIVTPVFVAKARVASRLMWWVRRYVPEVLPGIVILMSIALAAALVWRFRRTRVLAVPAVAVVVVLLVIYLGQSLPLRNHDEYGGSFQVTAEMASVAGTAKGVYLFGQTGCCTTPEYMFGGALWLERGEYDSLMPKGSQAVDYVRQVQAAMPGHPVFVVWGGSAAPSLGSIALTAARHITASLPMWEETYTSRPNKEGRPVLVDFTIWRVSGT